MSIGNNSVPTPQASAKKPPTRHLVQVSALVSTDGAEPRSMMIRDVSRRGMFLAFSDHAARDEPWSRAGVQILIRFAIPGAAGGQACSLRAMIRRRTADGLGAELLGIDRQQLDALRALVLASSPREGEAPARNEARTPATGVPTPVTSPLVLCEIAAEPHIAELVAAYLNAVASLVAGAPPKNSSAAQTREAANANAAFERARARLETELTAYFNSEFGRFLRGETLHPPSQATGAESGLSLVQSCDLGAAVTLTQAADRLAALLIGHWEELADRLAQLTPHVALACPLAPHVLCYRLHEAIREPPGLASAATSDPMSCLTSPPLVRRLESLYSALNATLEQAGIAAGRRRHPRLSA